MHIRFVSSGMKILHVHDKITAILALIGDATLLAGYFFAIVWIFRIVFAFAMLRDSLVVVVVFSVFSFSFLFHFQKAHVCMCKGRSTLYIRFWATVTHGIWFACKRRAHFALKNKTKCNRRAQKKYIYQRIVSFRESTPIITSLALPRLRIIQSAKGALTTNNVHFIWNAS